MNRFYYNIYSRERKRRGRKKHCDAKNAKNNVAAEPCSAMEKTEARREN